MKVYLAGSFIAQHRLRGIRDKLFATGHAVVGSWLDEVAKPDDMPKEIFDKQLAIKDLTEVREADCIILDTLEDSTTGGRYVEWGYAFGHAKLRYHVGPIKSIFERIADAHFDTWDSLFEYFSRTHAGSQYVATGMEGKEFVGLDTPKDVTGYWGIWVVPSRAGEFEGWYWLPNAQYASTYADAELWLSTLPNIKAWQKKGASYEIRPYKE